MLKHGSTTYRGQQHTPASLALKVLGPAPCRPLKDPAMFAHQLCIATWNAGGLGAPRYAELLGWLRSEREVGRPKQVGGREFRQLLVKFAQANKDQQAAGSLVQMLRDVLTHRADRTLGLCSLMLVNLARCLH